MRSLTVILGLVLSGGCVHSPPPSEVPSKPLAPDCIQNWDKTWDCPEPTKYVRPKWRAHLSEHVGVHVGGGESKGSPVN